MPVLGILGIVDDVSGHETERQAGSGAEEDPAVP
jgi:hypothetical protein